MSEKLLNDNEVCLLRLLELGRYLILHSVYLCELTENKRVCSVCILLTSITWKPAGCNAIGEKLLPTGFAVHQEFKNTHLEYQCMSKYTVGHCNLCE